MIQRGVLVVLLDLALITVIWTLNAAADGGLVRWASARVGRGLHSYRARLTFALFGFFVVPAVVFAMWSYQRLRSDDRQSRELARARDAAGVHCVSAVRRGSPTRRSGSARRCFSTRTASFARRAIRCTTRSRRSGRFLPTDIALSVSARRRGGEQRAQHVGGVPTLVGYRAAPIGRARRGSSSRRRRAPTSWRSTASDATSACWCCSRRPPARSPRSG